MFQVGHTEASVDTTTEAEHGNLDEGEGPAKRTMDWTSDDGDQLLEEKLCNESGEPTKRPPLWELLLDNLTPVILANLSLPELARACATCRGFKAVYQARLSLSQKCRTHDAIAAYGEAAVSTFTEVIIRFLKGETIHQVLEVPKQEDGVLVGVSADGALKTLGPVTCLTQSAQLFTPYKLGFVVLPPQPGHLPAGRFSYSPAGDLQVNTVVFVTTGADGNFVQLGTLGDWTFLGMRTMLFVWLRVRQNKLHTLLSYDASPLALLQPVLQATSAAGISLFIDLRLDKDVQWTITAAVEVVWPLLQMVECLHVILPPGSDAELTMAGEQVFHCYRRWVPAD